MTGLFEFSLYFSLEAVSFLIGTEMKGLATRTPTMAWLKPDRFGKQEKKLPHKKNIFYLYNYIPTSREDIHICLAKVDHIFSTYSTK